MGIGQPAMSAALARLRVLFQDPLLVRTSAGMMPTQRALEISHQVKQIFTLIETSLVPVSSGFEPTQVNAHINIAASEGIAFLFMPRVMAYLRSHAPGIQVTVRPSDNRRLREYLEEDQCDIALSFVRSPPPNLRSMKIYPQRLYCIASKSHPEIRKALSLDTYLRYPHVSWSADQVPYPSIEIMVDDALRKRNLTRVIGMRIPSILSTPAVVAATDMIATVPERIARHSIAFLPIQILRSPVELGEADISMFWHEKTQRDPLRSWLRTIIRDVALDLRRRERNVKLDP